MDFLYEVYVSTRYDVERLDWPESEIASFLRMQFSAQHQYYQQHYTGAAFQVISIDGTDIGRLYIDRRTDEIRIVDIALLKPYRSQGIGSSILGRILKEAAGAGKPVRIHVEKNNPALELYRRLGFVSIGDVEVYWLMEWSRSG